MTTEGEVIEAEALCRQQRTGFMHLLQIDITKGDPDTLRMVKAASAGDPFKFEAILAHRKVSALFAVGALFFGRAA